MTKEAVDLAIKLFTERYLAGPEVRDNLPAMIDQVLKATELFFDKLYEKQAHDEKVSPTKLPAATIPEGFQFATGASVRRDGLGIISRAPSGYTLIDGPGDDKLLTQDFILATPAQVTEQLTVISPDSWAPISVYYQRVLGQRRCPPHAFCTPTFTLK